MHKLEAITLIIAKQMCESEKKKKVNESCWASRNIGTALVMVVFNSYVPTFQPESLSSTSAKMMPTVNESGAIKRQTCSSLHIYFWSELELNIPMFNLST